MTEEKCRKCGGMEGFQRTIEFDQVTEIRVC
jgi:hypothetical protein